MFGDPNMPEHLDVFGHFVENDKGEVVFNFGKHKGDKASFHGRYLEWMQLQDFPEDTLEIVEEVLALERK